jgi:phage-related protein
MTKQEQQAAMMAQVLEKLAINTESLPEVTNTAAGQMANLGATIQNIKDDIGQAFLPVLTQLAGMFAEIASEYGPMLADGLGKVATFIIENLPPAIEIAKNVVAGFVSWWVENWPVIYAKVQEVWGNVKPILDTVVKWLTKEGPGALDVLTGIWKEEWAEVQKIVAIAVEWFEKNLPRIIETGEVLVRFWQEHIVPALDNIWKIICEIVETSMRVIMEVVSLVMDIICGDWEAAWEDVKTIATTIWDGIKTVAKEFVEGVANAIGTTTKEIVDTWRNNWEMLKAIVVGLADKIVESVRGFASTLFAAGEALFEGLRQGIESKVNEIIASIVGWINAIIAAGKAVLGIESPSAVFHDIGQQMMKGLQEGIASITPTVRAQLEAVVSPGGGGGGTVHNYYNPGGGGGGTVHNYYNEPHYHLTTQSITRPGALALEFQAMEAMTSR